MAHFIRGTDNGLTPIQHCRDIFKQYLMQLSLRGAMGKKGSGKPIIIDTGLKGQAGDSIVYHFIPQNDTDGIEGQNATILGNEDSLDEYSMSLKIDQMAKAFRKKGKMTDKRLIWKFREEAKTQLANWFAHRSERWLFDAMTGYISDGYTYVTNLATADLVNGSGRLIQASGTTGATVLAATSSDQNALDAAVTASDKMNTYLLDELEILAKQGNSKYRIRPVKVGKDGREMFVLYMSLKAARDLRQDTRFEKHKLALVEAGIADDPIASGALGVWNNIILKSSELVREFSVDDGYLARNLLVGADAAVLGYAQNIDYTEELTDHKRILSMAADEIRGQKKLQFDGVDMGVAQVITASN